MSARHWTEDGAGGAWRRVAGYVVEVFPVGAGWCARVRSDLGVVLFRKDDCVSRAGAKHSGVYRALQQARSDREEGR